MEETRVTEANDEQQQQQHLVESERKQSEEKEKEKGNKDEEQSEESHKKEEAKSSEDQEQEAEQEQEEQAPVPPRKEYQQQQPPPPSKKEEQRSAAPPKPQAAAANNGGGWGWGSLWSASSALVNDYILPLVGDTDEEQAEKREETEATNDAVKHQEEEEEEEEQDRAVELGKAAYSYVESMASAASSSLSAALSDKAVLERGREVGEWSTTMSFEFLERMGKATFDVLSKELAAAAAGISPQEDQANTTTSQRNDFTSPSHRDAASSDHSSFEACFEEKHGSIHLQALENLSTQCVVRLGQADGDLLAQLQESFQSIKDVLAQEEEDEDDDDDDEDEDEDEEEHEDESVGKDKRQAKDAKKASASPLPVNGLNRRARLKKKMIESFVKEAKNKVEELASFYEGELQEAVEEMKGKEDSAVTEHIMKTALEGFDKVCYQSMLILSELSANGIELLLRVAESYLVLEDTPARKEEPLERANFITALTTYLLKEVSELAMAYTRCLSAIKDSAGKANAASSAELAKVMTKESLRIHAYAGSASTNLECKSLFVSICQASLLLREEEQRKGQ